MRNQRKETILSYASSFGFVSIGAGLIWVGIALKKTIDSILLKRNLSSKAKSGLAATPELVLKAFSSSDSQLSHDLFWNIKETPTNITGKGIFQGTITTNHPIYSKLSGQTPPLPLIYQKTLNASIIESQRGDPRPKLDQLVIKPKRSPYFHLGQPNSPGTQKILVKNSEDVILTDIVKVIGEKIETNPPTHFNRWIRFISRLRLWNFGVSTASSEKELGVQVGSMSFVYGSFVFNKASKSLIINRPKIMASQIENIVNPVVEIIAKNSRNLFISSVFLGISIYFFTLCYSELRAFRRKNKELNGPAPISIIETNSGLFCSCQKAQKTILAEGCGHLVCCEGCQEKYQNTCPICKAKTYFIRVYVVEAI